MAESGDPSIVAIPHCPSLRPLEPETTPARVNKLSPRFATIRNEPQCTTYDLGYAPLFDQKYAPLFEMHKSTTTKPFVCSALFLLLIAKIAY